MNKQQTEDTRPNFLDVAKTKVAEANQNTGLSYEAKDLSMAEEALSMMLSGKSPAGKGLSYKEALTSRDFPMLLNKVINEKILMPVEPEYIGQSLLSTTVNVGKTTGLYNIPAFGWLTAAEVGEAQEYPEGTAEFNRNATSIMIKKYGIRVGVTAEMLDADELGLFGMHVMAAKQAMNRKKEEIIFQQFGQNTAAAFDNEEGFGTFNSSGNTIEVKPDLSTLFTSGTDTFKADSTDQGGPDTSSFDTNFRTNGRDRDGYLNGSLHLFDIVETMATLVADGYDPTVMLVHPIAWAVFAQNPMFNGFQYYNVSSNQDPKTSPAMQMTGPSDMASLRIPWALTMHVSPFVKINYNTLASNVPILTDVYIGSRKNGLILLQGKPLTQDAYSDLAREIYNVRLREYYGVGISDMGRSWKAIKNIRVTPSYDYATVKQIT